MSAINRRAGDHEIEKLRGGRGREPRAIPGDRQSGVERKQPPEIGARLIGSSQMGVGDDLDADSGDKARLVVRGAVGPFDHLFEASCDKMSSGDAARKKSRAVNDLKAGPASSLWGEEPTRWDLWPHRQCSERSMPPTWRALAGSPQRRAQRPLARRLLYPGSASRPPAAPRPDPADA